MSYGETRLGQGREKAREFLKENLELAREIEDKLVAQVMLKLPGGAERAAAAEKAAEAVAAAAGKGRAQAASS